MEAKGTVQNDPISEKEWNKYFEKIYSGQEKQIIREHVDYPRAKKSKKSRTIQNQQWNV